jgi:hypothetical protein
MYFTKVTVELPFKCQMQIFEHKIFQEKTKNANVIFYLKKKLTNRRLVHFNTKYKIGYLVINTDINIPYLLQYRRKLTFHRRLLLSYSVHI